MRAKQTKAAPSKRIDEVELLYQKVAFMRDEVNRRWGHERLKKLVPVDWRLRFEQAELRFSLAGQDRNLKAMREQAESVEKGWAKLEQLATEAGHTPLAPEVWSIYDQFGKRCYLVLNSEHRDSVPEDGGYVLTLDEIAKFIPKEISKIKSAFSGTKVEHYEEREDFNDPIPF